MVTKIAFIPCRENVERQLNRKPTVQRFLQYLVTTIVLLAPCAFFSTSFAAEWPDLPEAFDAGWKGEKTCVVLYETESVRVGRCSFPPGIGHEKHFHKPHFGYVLESGSMRITDESGAAEVRKTTAGNSWSTSEITIHEAINVGHTTTSYLVIEPKQ